MGLMITLTAEAVGLITPGAVKLAASVLPILGFRWPLIVLPGLESQIPWKSDCRPSSVVFRHLERPCLSSGCPVFEPGEDGQTAKTRVRDTQQQSEGCPGSC